MTSNTPRLGTIEAACRLIGGDQPIHPSTYYRGAKAGIYPTPKKVAPNVARVDLDRLAAMLRSRLDEPEAA
ncbi:MAG: hypothetical protein GEU95_00785 [Rhizobiales bacterium]|nr:hypothetical protein [Hyphomicrobiales bacterium]